MEPTRRQLLAGAGAAAVGGLAGCTGRLTAEGAAFAAAGATLPRDAPSGRPATPTTGPRR